MATAKEGARKHLLLILLAVGIFLGILLPVIMIIVSSKKYNTREVMYVGFGGELLINMLTCLSLPLIVAGLITSVAYLKSGCFNLLLQIVIYMVILKFFAAILGVALGCAFIPKKYDVGDVALKPEIIEEMTNTSADGVVDILRNVFPDNVVGMLINSYQTVIVPSNKTGDMYKWEIQRGGKMRIGVNSLGMICYSLLFGAALGALRIRAYEMLRVFGTFYRLIFLITGWVMWAIPLLSIFVIASAILRAHSAGYLVTELIMFIAAVITGHLIQCLLIYPVLYFTLLWENPFKLLWECLPALLTGFVTASSFATLPVTIRCLEEKANVDRRLVKFVIPIAHCINKDGSAIFFGACPVVIIRLASNALNFGRLLAVTFSAIITSIAAEGILYRNAMCFTVLLDAADVSRIDIGVLLAVGWIVDRTATVTNIVGDIFLVKIIAAYNASKFEDVSIEDMAEDEIPEEEDDNDDEDEDDNDDDK